MDVSYAGEIERRAIITKTEGSVLVQASGQPFSLPAKKGAELTKGDRITTGSDGRVEIRFDDGSISRISPDSRVEIESLYRDTIGDGDNTFLNVGWGKAWYRIPDISQRNSRFEVNTPSAVAGVRGTAFAVDAYSDNDTVVRVYAGAVGVRPKQTSAAPGGIGDSSMAQEVLVNPHQQTRVSVDAPPPAAEPVDVMTVDDWEKDNLVEDVPVAYVVVESEVKTIVLEMVEQQLKEGVQELAELTMELERLRELQEEATGDRLEELKRLESQMERELEIKREVVQEAERERQEVAESKERLTKLREVIDKAPSEITPEEIEAQIREEAQAIRQEERERAAERAERQKELQQKQEEAEVIRQETSEAAESLGIKESLEEARSEATPETVENILQEESEQQEQVESETPRRSSSGGSSIIDAESFEVENGVFVVQLNKSPSSAPTKDDFLFKAAWTEIETDEFVRVDEDFISTIEEHHEVEYVWDASSRTATFEFIEMKPDRTPFSILFSVSYNGRNFFDAEPFKTPVLEPQMVGNVLTPEGTYLDEKQGQVQVRKEIEDRFGGEDYFRVPITENGEFFIRGLEDGNYYIQALPNYESPYAPSTSVSFTVEGGTTVDSHVTLELSYPQSIGEVLTPEEELLLDNEIGWVNVFLPGDHPRPYRTKIFPNGTFKLWGLEDGEYELEARSFMHAPSERIAVIVEDNHIDTEITLNLNKPQVLGNVKTPTGEFLNPREAWVTVFDTDKNWIKEVPVGPGGVFSLWGLYPESEYIIKASPQESVDYAQSQEKRITIDSENVGIALSEIQIRGEVIGPAGGAFEDAYIGILNLETNEYQGVMVDWTKFGRTYKIGSLEDGSYILRAMPSIDSEYTPSVGKTVMVEGGIADLAELDFQLTEPQVEGTVIVPGDESLKQGDVWIAVLDEHNNWIYDVPIGNAGEFKLGGLEEGKVYTVGAYPVKGVNYQPVEILVIIEEDVQYIELQLNIDEPIGVIDENNIRFTVEDTEGYKAHYIDYIHISDRYEEYMFDEPYFDKDGVFVIEDVSVGDTVVIQGRATEDFVYIREITAEMLEAELFAIGAESNNGKVEFSSNIAFDFERIDFVITIGDLKISLKGFRYDEEVEHNRIWLDEGLYSFRVYGQSQDDYYILRLLDQDIVEDASLEFDANNTAKISYTYDLDFEQYYQKDIRRYTVDPNLEFFSWIVPTDKDMILSKGSYADSFMPTLIRTESVGNEWEYRFTPIICEYYYDGEYMLEEDLELFLSDEVIDCLETEFQYYEPGEWVDFSQFPLRNEDQDDKYVHGLRSITEITDTREPLEMEFVIKNPEGTVLLKEKITHIDWLSGYELPQDAMPGTYEVKLNLGESMTGLQLPDQVTTTFEVVVDDVTLQRREPTTVVEAVYGTDNLEELGELLVLVDDVYEFNTDYVVLELNEEINLETMNFKINNQTVTDAVYSLDETDVTKFVYLENGSFEPNKESTLGIYDDDVEIVLVKLLLYREE